MAFGNVRSDFLPYCIKQIKKGHYAILNREYKPLGQRTHDWAKYEDHMVRIKGLTSKRAAKISVHGNGDLTEIYLYHDGCIPDRNPNHMAAYLERLGHFAKLKVEDAVNETTRRLRIS